MDLMGPTHTLGYNGEKYILVIVDDFSRMTFLYLLKSKDQAFDRFVSFKRQVERMIDRKIKCIRTDRGEEFVNQKMIDFCDNHGIRRQYSAPHTPQQNGVVERKNRTIQEMARTLLNDSGLSEKHWTFAVHTAVYIINRCLLRPHEKRVPYELWFKQKPTVSFFKVFGCKCWILRKGSNLGKFDDRSDEGIFLGYSSHSKAYKCYN